MRKDRLATQHTLWGRTHISQTWGGSTQSALT